MARQIQLRRGTTSQHSTFTGALGEVTVDTDKDVAVIHDGSTAGGFPLVKATSLADVATSGDYDDLSNLPTLGTAAAADSTDFVAVTGDTMTGSLILSADPSAALGAATKQYVDTIAAAGIHYHAAVRVEAPSALNATYDNGTAGVGATLTNAGTQAAISIDGIALDSADRVLVYNQTNAAHNGVYTVTTVGDGASNWVLTRATDADSYGASDPDSLGEGDAFFVKEGDTGAGELYVMNTSGAITFGTTDITFTVIAETAVFTAGTGLTLDGTQFNIDSTVLVDGDLGTSVQAYSSVLENTTASYTIAEESKLSGIEAGADVTDSANVNPLVDTHLNTSSASNGEYLSWNGSDYDWATVPAGYTDADVDTHLNTSSATTGQFLSWNGSDYDWDTVSTTVSINDLTDGYSAGGSVGLGFGSLANDDGSTNNNTAVGTNSGNDITTGASNTLVGWSSGQRLTTGFNNTAIGYSALEYSLDAEKAVAVGREALYSGANNRHVGNVGVGYRAGFSITTGQNNIFVGDEAGRNTTSAGNNFFGGRQAGYLNSTGQQNIFLGANAGYTTTTGSNNVVIGYDIDASSATVSNEITLGNTSITSFRIPGLQSGASNGDVLTYNSSNGDLELAPASGGATDIDGLSDAYSDGSSIGFGSGALSNDDGTTNNNIAIGVDALSSNTSGNQTIAIGHDAGKAQTNGGGNVFVGEQAGRANNSSSNVCVGGFSGHSATNVEGQTFVGYQAGYLLNRAVTTAVGYRSMLLATTASSGTAVGAYALENLTTGIGNTALGISAGANITTGGANVLIGRRAADNATTIENCIVIGKDAEPSNNSVASNEITLGNTSITLLRCNTQTISSLSDKRDKKNVEDIGVGLDFLKTLRPVSFDWDQRDKGRVDLPDVGFIAQELLEAQKQSGVHVPNLVSTINPDKLEAAYSTLIPVLVQAIKDLSQQVDDLKNKS